MLTTQVYGNLLKASQHLRDFQMERYVLGEMPTQKRAKYLRNDERILNIVNTFDIRTIEEYLRGLANNFLME